jgi:hypothetical protein
MHSPTTTDPLRHSHENGGTTVTGIRAPDQRAQATHDLAESRAQDFQFQRIAQLQAEWDILWARFINS